MSHKKLLKSGKISRTEYNRLVRLKRSATLYSALEKKYARRKVRKRRRKSRQSGRNIVGEKSYRIFAWNVG